MPIYQDIEKALERLPGNILEILQLVAFYSRKIRYSTYIVGGTVRDLLLGVGLKDLDIVVVGDAINLVNALCEDIKCRVTVYSRFKTATVEFYDGFSVDFVTARKEVYPCPAALPQIEPSSLYQDMFRRDFTVNAMAIDLGLDSKGELIDYFGGFIDLKSGILRVMHDNSFIDDPTRIFRCIRFKHRYGFDIESHTVELIGESIKSGFPLLLSKDRIAREMRLIFSERHPYRLIKTMVDIGLWKLLFPGTDVSSSTYHKIKKVSCGTEQQSLFVALALLDDIDSPNLQDILVSYNCLAHQLKLMRSREKEMGRDLKNTLLEDYNLYRLYKGIDRKVIEYTMLVADTACYRQNLERYLERLKDFPFYVSGNDIREVGVPPGPVYRDLLESARREILNKDIRDREKQLQVIKNLVSRGGAKRNGG